MKKYYTEEQINSAFDGRKPLVETVLRQEISDDIDDLEQIRLEMKKLVNNAYDIVESLSNEVGDKIIADRARSYWVAHIKSALGDEEYESGSATSVEDTIDEIRYAAQGNSGD